MMDTPPLKKNIDPEQMANNNFGDILFWLRFLILLCFETLCQESTDIIKIREMFMI